MQRPHTWVCGPKQFSTYVLLGHLVSLGIEHQETTLGHQLLQSQKRSLSPRSALAPARHRHDNLKFKGFRPGEDVAKKVCASSLPSCSLKCFRCKFNNSLIHFMLSGPQRHHGPASKTQAPWAVRKTCISVCCLNSANPFKPLDSFSLVFLMDVQT